MQAMTFPLLRQLGRGLCQRLELRTFAVVNQFHHSKRKKPRDRPEPAAGPSLCRVRDGKPGAEVKGNTRPTAISRWASSKESPIGECSRHTIRQMISISTSQDSKVVMMMCLLVIFIVPRHEPRVSPNR